MDALLEASGLHISAGRGKERVLAVRGLDLRIEPGEILGLVGESGCGKSLTALAIAGLLPPGVSVTGGNLLFDGRDLASLSPRERRNLQGRDISMIFQEPMTSLNPTMRIGRQVEEVLALHTGYGKEERRARVLDILARVGLTDPAGIAERYPHQLSGGMRQRVVIAMAVILRPRLIIADEPTTALDVTIQAQILDLLRQINRDSGCAILFISHDLGVVSRLCDRVTVLYAGRAAECGSTRNIFLHPVHPYTEGLLGAIPGRDTRGRELAGIPGRVPVLAEKMAGCAFASRCRQSAAVCFRERPAMIALGPEHGVACHRVDRESEMEHVRI